MKVIYKYDITEALLSGHPMSLELPVGSVFLSAHEQHKLVCVWFLVPLPAAGASIPQEERTFSIRATGMPFDMESSAVFLGTVHMAAGGFVFHVFEVTKA